MTEDEIAKTFAEAILVNHQDGIEINVEVWRNGIVILAKQYLQKLEFDEWFYGN